jgi:FKBP-type peptidyl-prolyl cis-trans isomerase
MRILRYLLFLFFSGNVNSNIAQNNKPVTKPATSTAVLKTSIDSLQYSAGVYIAALLKNNGLQQMYKQPMFQRGISNKLSNTTVLLEDSVVMTFINQYIQKLAEENSKLQENELFKALRSKQGIGVLPSGVNYEIISKGTGATPTLKDSVIVNIKGQTVSGVVIIDSYRDKQTTTLNLTSIIKGLSEPLTLMPEGSKWNIYIPSSMAYGDKGITGIVPPFNALVFEVELLKIKPASVSVQ